MGLKIGEIKTGVGCLTVFGGIFLVAGLVVGGFAISNLWQWFDAQDWQSVNAEIISADLNVSHGDDSTTYEAVAVYRYQFDGRMYTSERVSFSGGSDNIGSFHQDIYQTISEHQRNKQTMPAWVDPDQPDQAVLIRDMRWGLFGFMMIFPLVFGGAGAGVIAMGVIGGRRAKKEAQLEDNNPDQPWMWRPEWQQPALKSQNKIAMWFAIGFASLWNLISMPLLFLLPAEILEKRNYPALLGLLFPLVGVGLIVWAVHSWKQWKRFGQSRLVLKSNPVPLGGALDASLECPTGLPAGAELEVTLSCVHKRVTGSGDNRSTRENYLWQDEQRITLNAGHLLAGTQVPIHFVLPADQPVSDWQESSSQIIWRLQATSDIEGVDYNAQFELPVFDRGADYHVEPSVQQPQAVVADGGDWTRTGVQHDLVSGGQRYAFPAARNKTMGFTILLFGLVFLGSGLGAGIWGRWIIGGTIFVLFGLLISWWGVYVLGYRSEVVVQRGELKLRRGLFHLGAAKQFYSFKLKRLKLDKGTRSGSKQYYDLVAETNEGKKLKLAHTLPGRRDCQALLDRIAKQMGMETGISDETQA